MDALDTQPGSADRVVARPGSAADTWFRALDGRILRIGATTCMTQVLGIHGNGSDLWIQMACAENPALSLVLHVGPATRVDDVLQRLGTDPPTGVPLEVISFAADTSQVLADATAQARAARLPH